MVLVKNVIAVCLLLGLFASNAIAQTSYGDIQLLIKQGQYKEALKLTDKQLSQDQADIKLKFMKGLILTRLERFDAAERVFIDLTKDSPELPEPFNNLAVVYAAQGKYTQAEEALKSAINTHPSYATAHENLGDIYAKMASRAYNQALELDTSNKAAREKLSLVNELISAPTEPGKTAVAAAPKAVAKVETKPKSERVIPKPIPKQEIITVKVEPEAESKLETPKAKPDEEAKAENNREEVKSAIYNWADAWSAQDVDTYVASYGKEFIPPKRMSRSAWERERRKRITKPGFIKISLSEMKINLHGKDYAEVKFTQKYQSDTYGDKVKKEVLMRRVDNKWLITQERTR